MYGIIYKITCLVNKKLYIGQTIRSLKARWASHISDSGCKNSTSKLHRAIKRYGSDQFEIEIIEECIDQEALDSKEVYWIDHYKSISQGYNILSGGKSGFTGFNHTEKAKKRISTALKGRVVSEETRKKHSERIKAQGGIPNFELGRQRFRERVKETGSPKKGISVSEDQKKKQALTMTGRLHSEETKQKISDSMKGRKLSEAHKANLRKPRNVEEYD